MKNKKLFAILTLVCFMFTLMPVAAFAATDVYGVDTATDLAPTGVAIYGYVDDADRVLLNADAYATLNVTTNGAYFVYATDAAGKLVNVTVGEGVEVGKTFVVNEKAASATTPGSFEVKFDKAGTYTLALAPYLSTAQAVKVANASYDWTDAEVLAFLQSFEGVAMYNNTVKVGEVEDSIVVNVVMNTSAVAADGGFSEATGYVQVTNNGYGVPNVEVDLYTDSYGLQVTKIDAKTNAAGIATFKVTGTIASGERTSFNVYASYEGKTASAPVRVTSLGAASVTTVAEPKAPVNKGTSTTRAGIEFKFADANGANVAPGVKDTNYKVTVVAAPAGYDKTAIFDVALNADSTAYVIAGPALNYEGDYTFQVALKNGATATGSVKVMKQGEPVAIAFAKAPTTVTSGAVSFNVAPNGIVSIDANGVTAPVRANSYSVNGKAVAGFVSPMLSVDSDEDFIGAKITVLAVYKYNNKTFTATNELTVVDTATEIVYVNTNAEVGQNSTLAAKVVDVNGKVIDMDGAAVEVIVLSTPDNAVANARGVYVPTKDIINVTFLASAPGEYKIQTIATLGGEYVSSIDTITVGGAEGTFKDVIVMSIGANNLVKNSEVVAMPAAPEIVDSRTMVPARAGLEAFGATVVWDEATRTVTAEMNGVKVVMEIGEKEYTVNGKTVVGDAAPYITEASTMVPVSFFTNAFGIVATPIYDANGVCDVLFTK